MKRILSASILLAMFGALMIPAQSALAMHEGICAGVIRAEAAGDETYTRNGVTYDITFGAGGSGNQAIIGTEGADTIDGGSGDDIVCGLGGGDVISGGSGNDILIGDIGLDPSGDGSDPEGGENPANAGNDTISGGSGADVLYGDAGNDDLSGGGGNDSFFGGPGTDDCDGGSGTNNFNPAVVAAACENIED